MRKVLDNLRDIHWDIYLEHMVDLREVPPRAYQMVLDIEILTSQYWDSNLV